MDTTAWYREFAVAEARGQSPCFEEWSLGVAADEQLLGLIGELPEAKRQPNLLFAAARFTGIAPGGFASFRAALLASWPQVRQVMLDRRVQTNEPGRCAALMPLLASLPQPLALLEVGASAGLCLYPDKFSYQYGERAALDPAEGPSAVRLSCSISGPVPLPGALPEVLWRAGIDLNPLDVRDSAHMRWLETLIWPEQDARRRRLAAAIEVARSDPPHLVAGHLNEVVMDLAVRAPADATLVIFHTAVLAYLDESGRVAFRNKIRDLPGHWISQEGPGVFPGLARNLPPAPDDGRARYVLALDGGPVGYAAPHGQDLLWCS